MRIYNGYKRLNQNYTLMTDAYEYNMDYRPNEYNQYPMDNYNYYENEQGFDSNNYVYEENGKRNKFLEESKSIEDKINEKIDYERISLYIDAILSQPFMSENTPCFPKINIKSDIQSFPIIIIHGIIIIFFKPRFSTNHNFTNFSSNSCNHNFRTNMKTKLII